MLHNSVYRGSSYNLQPYSTQPWAELSIHSLAEFMAMQARQRRTQSIYGCRQRVLLLLACGSASRATTRQRHRGWRADRGAKQALQANEVGVERDGTAAEHVLVGAAASDKGDYQHMRLVEAAYGVVGGGGGGGAPRWNVRAAQQRATGAVAGPVKETPAATTRHLHVRFPLHLDEVDVHQLAACYFHLHFDLTADDMGCHGWSGPSGFTPPTPRRGPQPQRWRQEDASLAGTYENEMKREGEEIRGEDEARTDMYRSVF